MKAKHISLIFSSVLLVIAVFSGVHIWDKNQPRSTVAFAKINQPLPVITVNEDQLDVVAKEMFTFAKYQHNFQDRTDLSALGYAPSQREYASSEVIQEQESSPDYHVSMAIVFDGNRYCVINNQFYKEGESISNNITVRKILKERVLIREYGKDKWHEIANGRFIKKEDKNELLAFTDR